jgi:hypothetical protein
MGYRAGVIPKRAKLDWVDVSVAATAE